MTNITNRGVSLHELDEGSTDEIMCHSCSSRDFIRVRELVHNIRVCEECTHTCKGELQHILGPNSCVPCIINKIVEFVTFCITNENNVTPDKIEEIVEGWVTWKQYRWRFRPKGLIDYDDYEMPRDNGMIIWEEYWRKLCNDKIVMEKGDMYNWLNQLGHNPDCIISCQNTHTVGSGYFDVWTDYCDTDDIDRAFYVICKSAQIKDKMREGVREGKRILTKRENIKIKHYSLIKYVFDIKERNFPGLHSLFAV